MRSVNFSDSELLNGLVSRDERILREFYSLYFKSVRSYVLKNNGNEDDARDLFQDVLLVIYQKVRKEPLELTCALGTYLYSIARFLWLKELAKRKLIAYQTIEEEKFVDTDSDLGSINDKNERLVLFRKCFDKLSESCKKVLILFNEGHSIAEITKIMGYNSEQHTKNRRYRCKLSLINIIKTEDDYKTVSYGNNTKN